MSDLKYLWSPLKAENIQNPYPMYERLREQDPVHLAQTGEWIITEYNTIQSVLKDKRFLSGNRLEWLKRSIVHLEKKNVGLKSITDAMVSFLLMMNPPEHTQLRQVIMKAWDNSDVTSFIEGTVDSILIELDSKKEFDLVRDYAQVIPVKTMCYVLGVRSTDVAYLKELGNEILKTLDLYVSFKDLERMNSGAEKFIKFFEAYIRNIEKDNTSLLTKVVRYCKENHINLSEKELISIAIFLFVAGVETSSSLIGTGLLNLSRNPLQKSLLLNENADVERAITELLRFDAPVQIIGRVASVDIEVEGKLIPKGSYLTLCLGSANRDPKHFEEPDTLKIDREKNRHMAFGHGIHYCLSDWLGKLQGEIAIKKFIEKFPHYTIPEQGTVWNRNLAVRSLSSLKVYKG